MTYRNLCIGGLQKNSFIDYPGKISCVIFIAGCNFSCPYCHNPSLVKDYSCHFSQENILNFLKKHKGFLDAAVISGGEPTLHSKQLVLFCQKIKELGYLLKIDTNGSKPEVIKELINRKLLNYIAMDIKTDPADISKYSALAKNKFNYSNILSSIELIMESGLAYEFKTTCVRPFIDKNMIKNILNHIQGAELYVLQQFHKAEVLEPSFFCDKKNIYTHNELIKFKSLAEDYVGKCIIR